MNRPEYRNAQNSAMTYQLDEAFYRATADDEVAVIVLAGAGKHFSAGHDIGTPGRDVGTEFERRATVYPTHVGAASIESRWIRENEVYLGMCRRWRAIPKPTIAQVQGACVAGGLMLAWVCDLIVAADNAFFADPVLAMGIPGVEYFAHPWALNPRLAKEFLFLGQRLSAARAFDIGMINRVVPVDELEHETAEIARQIARQPRLALDLAKRAVNQAEDAMGLQVGLDAAFGLHHLGHANSEAVTGDPLAGLDGHGMRARNGF
jgi:enoyl-CoA hydratase